MGKRPCLTDLPQELVEVIMSKLLFSDQTYLRAVYFEEKFPSKKQEICASRKGWLLMRSDSLFFFYYPFTDETIGVPYCEINPSSEYDAIFSCPPTSLDCHVYIIEYDIGKSTVYIKGCNLKENRWTTTIFKMDSFSVLIAMLDRSEMSWVKIKGLGGRALFWARDPYFLPESETPRNLRDKVVYCTPGDDGRLLVYILKACDEADYRKSNVGDGTISLRNNYTVMAGNEYFYSMIWVECPI
ncbi:hypothetical protein GIB67_007573 [Kingdonia uniflora]|uniref:KIB1-4 beta-propeller domain-containing protein n=1 Tax=Kingdonia uniflora TaxID=39325 RepID=A0A7J7N1P6_9MAGN|nr:hypothetical protein GIB67_007573 [Kingdonia uniflora]